jgi:hypothetical protein
MIAVEPFVRAISGMERPAPRFDTAGKNAFAFNVAI